MSAAASGRNGGAQLTTRAGEAGHTERGATHSPVPSRFAPKLTVEQRRTAVRMHSAGTSLRSVARHFGVWPAAVAHLVRSPRYCAGGRTIEAHNAPASPPPADSGVRIATPRAGVDLLVYDLPRSTHRTLEKLAEDVGWSVAAFVREVIVCSVLPSPPHRAMPIRRVGLRHRVSTWKGAG